MDNNRQKRKTQYIVFAILALIAIAILFIVEYNSSAPDYPNLIQNTSISILCSIAASALFCILQDAGKKDQADEFTQITKALAEINNMLGTQNIDGIQSKLEDLNNNLRVQTELYDSGIRSIRKKSYYDKDGAFWKNIIESTSDRMDLIGHSISKWFDEEYKSFFVQKIERMLKDGKEVRIILSGAMPDIKKICAAESTNNEAPLHGLSKLENTCYELRQIVRNLPWTARNRLKVYVADLSKVTYMYIRTDKQCFISPYICSETNKSNSFLLELQTKIEYSKCFDDDFQEMLRTCATRINLTG